MHASHTVNRIVHRSFCHFAGSNQPPSCGFGPATEFFLSFQTLSILLFNAFSYKGLEKVLKSEMRLTPIGVAGCNPQITGWIAPQADRVFAALRRRGI